MTASAMRGAPAAMTAQAATDGIADVIARMEEIDGSLPRKDGVAYFNRLYLQVTKAVLEARGSTTFEDPDTLARLDVVFADFYFDAEATVGSGATCPVAWRPLIETRSEAREPIQFALAGMNAHINNDLALAVVKTCGERGLAPDDDSPLHADYERVNALLQTVEQEVAGWYDSGLIADVEDITPKRADEALAMWSIVAARDVAWEHAKVIWELREHTELAKAYEAVLARTTELSSRAMLV